MRDAFNIGDDMASAVFNDQWVAELASQDPRVANRHNAVVAPHHVDSGEGQLSHGMKLGVCRPRRQPM